MITKATTPFFLFFLIQGLLFAQLDKITAGNDWNNGGGNPQRNGLSTQNGPLTDSTLWQVDSGSLFGLPVYIEGNKLITMKFIEMTNSPVVCYNLTTGQLLWQKEVTGLAGRSLPLGIRDGQVYVMRLTESLEDSMFALDATTGERVWASEKLVSTSITNSANFASNGDIFIESWSWIETWGRMCRIDRLTGHLIWECVFLPPVVGESELTVYQNTGYLINNIQGVIYITAIDLNTGQMKYSYPLNDTHPGGPVPECPIMIGVDGTIFFHKQGDNVSAFSDDGTQLTLLWETEIFGNAPFSIMCVGSDGSIYAPSNGRIVRLNPTTGQKLDSTAVLANPDLFMLRISASANGVIYATNGESNIYAFTLNLEQLWSDNIPFTNTSGVAIGSNGLIAAAGANLIKVYTAGNPVSVEDEITLDEFILSQNYPNPFNPSTTIKYQIPSDANVSLKVYDVLGKEVAVLVNEFKAAGIYDVKFDASNLSSGIYLYKIETGSFIQTRKMILTK